MKSEIYAVATMLNISQLKIWYKRTDFLYIKQAAALKVLDVLNVFDKKVEDLVQVETQTKNTSFISGSDDSLAGFLEDVNVQNNDELLGEVRQMNLETEKIQFIKLIDENKIESTSTRKFWLKNKSKFLFLKNLAEILLNIPSSSAFIERYYSCGIICKQRCGNITSKQIIERSL
jgi:hypothetical protein